MRKLIGFIFLLLSFSSLYAANLDSLTAGNNAIAVSPQQAFRVTAVLESATQIRIHFNIMPDFYIYKDRLSIINDSPPGFTAKDIHLPSGFKMNIFNGESYAEETVLNTSFDVLIPLARPQDQAKLSVHLQGCDGKTICYPPQNYAFELGEQNMFNHLKDLFTQIYSGGGSNLLANPFELFLIFLVAGFAISLTPCMYPLYPIALSAISQSATKRTNIIKLALCYIHGISLIYVAMGVIAAFSGHLLITLIQTTVFVLVSSGVFLLLGLAMFDLLEIKLPNKLHSYIHMKSSGLNGGGYLSAFVLGILSSLLLGPCVTPPLIIAIGFIASSGKVVNGILGLYAISLGMGIPILVLSTVGKKLLPKSGAWMNGIKHVLGFIIIALAIYLAYPLINLGNSLLSIGVLCYITALAFLLIKQFRSPDLELLIHKLMPILMIMIGLVFTLLSSYKQPTDATVQQNGGHKITSISQVNSIIQSSSKPVIIIVSAKWCSICREMEATTFKNTQLQEQFKRYTLINFDITESTPDSNQFLHQYNLYGPPAIIILDKNKTLKEKLTGYISAQDLIQRTRSY